MDPATLAKELVPFLAPFLPYLLKGIKVAGEAGAKKIGELSSEVVFEQAKAIWQRLHKNEKVTQAAEEVADNPKDEDAQAALRLQVRKTLESDPALADEIARLWEAAKAGGTPGQAATGRSVVIGGSVTSSTIITGDQNKIER